jgi:NADPH:quinone reductase-like Zn-dependent oxidoreductase
MMSKRARIHSSTLRPRPLEEKALTARAMERSVLPFFESDAIHVPIADVYPLDRATDAYERFSGGGKLGKIILEMSG